MSDDDVIANSVYRELYRQLRSREDIEPLSELSGVPQAVLKQMLSQKLSRGVRKNFHRLKARLPQFVREWKAGKSFLDIARANDFSPVMMARLILFSLGWTKYQFNGSLLHTGKIPDPRIKKELEQAIAEDVVFAPHESQRAKEAGEELEGSVKHFLESHGISAIPEKENTGSGKTPDFLFHSPHNVMGKETKWIECKASFGDEEETRRNLIRQVSPYHRLFGPGIVVYGLGMVENPATIDGVRVVSRKMLGV